MDLKCEFCGTKFLPESTIDLRGRIDDAIDAGTDVWDYKTESVYFNLCCRSCADD